MRTLKKLAALPSLIAVLATGASAANGASVVDVQFSRDPGLQQTGAAVIGSAGDTWNDFLGNVGSGSLVDASGAASGISLSFSAALVYESDPNFTQFTGTPYANLMQGYLEQSNVQPLREMVDLVIISRAYEANQKMITTIDQEMQKALDALG